MLLVDLVLIVLLVYAGMRGYRRGFVFVLSGLVGSLLGVLIAYLGYQSLGGAINTLVHTTKTFANVLAFGLIWLVVDGIYTLVSRRIFPVLPLNLLKHKLNLWAGSVASVAKAMVLLAIGLIIFAGLPLHAGAKEAITNARIPRILLSTSGQWQRQIGQLVGKNLGDTLNFLTVRPKSEDSIELGFTTTNVRVNEAAEQAMLRFVNRERTARGLSSLVMDPKIQVVARAHSRDMFARGYFSHINPDGLDPFDRMDRGGIRYQTAGENLALAPTVIMAHNGLMNSPGHRANILTPEYNKVGIGAIDGGPYGLMFTQNFTD